MDVAVTGSSGFIGRPLVAALRGDGHQVRRVVRRTPGPEDVAWDPAAGTIDLDALAGVDAVVHLAGEGIDAKRWTARQKRRVLESRTSGTDTIAKAVARLDPPPSVLVSASAIGYYGDRGDEVLTEDSGPGDNFLADVCVAWEGAALPAVLAGVRTTFVRTGIVLDPSGGALARMLPLFKLGLGGPMGGDQWWSWISLPDTVHAIVHLLEAEVAGPVNLTAPEPVTNAELTRVLGAVLRRPTLVPVPRFGPQLLLGRELAQTVVYTSARVAPTRLEASRYPFRHPRLEPALRAVLGKPAS